MSEVVVMKVNSANLPAFISLIGMIEGEANPSDEMVRERATAGVHASLVRYDFTHSDSCWMLLATLGDAPAGYASVVRIPKADARVGFLFVDELYVLQAFRRAGVARALLDAVEQLAVELGLAGVRLLVRIENEAARNLYRKAGYAQSQTTFCEKRFPS